MGGDPIEKNRLKKLDISVWWWVGDTGQAQSGVGRLTAQSTRIINEKTKFDGF